MRENLVPLAGSGTTLCHGAVKYRQRTWDDTHGVYIDPDEVAAGIRRHLRTDQIRYIIDTKGGDWLNRVYPTQH